MDLPNLTNDLILLPSALPADQATGSGCLVKAAGTELVLMPNRMAWWPDRKVLLLADSHFGKAATFRKAGLPVPLGTTGRMLEVLSAAVKALEPSRLVVLGDLIHSVTAAHLDFERDLFEWRQKHASLPITLVLGNHDRGRPELFSKLRLDLCPEEYCDPFHFCHDPLKSQTASGRFRLGGHIHPGVRLGIESQPLPCFWQGADFLVFPAFGAFTGLAQIAPAQQDVLYPIADGQIASIKASAARTAVQTGRIKP